MSRCLQFVKPDGSDVEYYINWIRPFSAGEFLMEQKGVEWPELDSRLSTFVPLRLRTSLHKTLTLSPDLARMVVLAATLATRPDTDGEADPTAEYLSMAWVVDGSVSDMLGRVDFRSRTLVFNDPWHCAVRFLWGFTDAVDPLRAGVVIWRDEHCTRNLPKWPGWREWLDGYNLWRDLQRNIAEGRVKPSSGVLGALARWRRSDARIEEALLPGWQHGTLKLKSVPNGRKPAVFVCHGVSYTVAGGKAWDIVCELIRNDAFDGHGHPLDNPGAHFRRQHRSFFVERMTKRGRGKDAGWYIKTT